MVVVGVSIKNGGMQWHAASKGTAAVAASIIRTVRPDEYKEWIERHVSNRGRDAIVYEQIESGAQLLFYGGGQFKSTVLSF